MGDYLGRIRDAIRAGVLPAGVNHVHVQHGYRCPLGDTGRGRCTCHPRITVTVAGERLVIGDGGAVLERTKLQ